MMKKHWLMIAYVLAFVFFFCAVVFAVPIEMNSNVVISYDRIVTMEKFVQRELGLEYKWRHYNIKGFPRYASPWQYPKAKYSFGTIFFDGKDEGTLIHEIAHVYGASEWQAHEISWKWLYQSKD